MANPAPLAIDSEPARGDGLVDEDEGENEGRVGQTRLEHSYASMQAASQRGEPFRVLWFRGEKFLYMAQRRREIYLT